MTTEIKIQKHAALSYCDHLNCVHCPALVVPRLHFQHLDPQTVSEGLSQGPSKAFSFPDASSRPRPHCFSICSLFSSYFFLHFFFFYNLEGVYLGICIWQLFLISSITWKTFHFLLKSADLFCLFVKLVNLLSQGFVNHCLLPAT